MPDSFFLEHKLCRYMLSVMVHRRNTELSTDARSSAITRNDQRQQNRSVVEVARREGRDGVASVARGPRSNGSMEVARGAPQTLTEREKLQMKAVRQGIRGNKVSTEDTRSRTVVRKMKALREIQGIIEKKEGVDWYENQMLRLRDEIFQQDDSSGDDNSDQDNDADVEEEKEGDEEEIEEEEDGEDDDEQEFGVHTSV